MNFFNDFKINFDFFELNAWKLFLSKQNSEQITCVPIIKTNANSKKIQSSG